MHSEKYIFFPYARGYPKQSALLCQGKYVAGKIKMIFKDGASTAGSIPPQVTAPVP
jgi:hypothetical protein